MADSNTPRFCGLVPKVVHPASDLSTPVDQLVSQEVAARMRRRMSRLKRKQAESMPIAFVERLADKEPHISGAEVVKENVSRHALLPLQLAVTNNARSLRSLKCRDVSAEP